MKLKMFKLKNKRKVFYRWVVSYFAVLIPLLIVGITFFQVTKNSMVDEINHSNQILLRQTQYNADLLMNNIQTFSAEVAFDLAIQPYFDVQKPLTVTDYLDLTKLGNDYFVVKKSNRPIDLSYIYFCNIDLVLSEHIISDSNKFFNSLKITNPKTAVEWREQLLESNKPRYVSGMRTDDTGKIKNTITHILTLPVNSQTQKSIVLVNMVDVDRIFETARDGIGDNGAAFVLNGNEILASMSGENTYSDIDFSQLPSDNNGLITAYSGGEKVVVSYIKSEIDNIRFALVIPYSQFWAKVQMITNFSIIAILLSAILSILLINFFTKRNYAPINEMLNKLVEFSRRDSEEYSDEYRVMNEIISDTIFDNQKMSTHIENQNRALKNNFLARLLNGYISHPRVCKGIV